MRALAKERERSPWMKGKRIYKETIVAAVSADNRNFIVAGYRSRGKEKRGKEEI